MPYIKKDEREFVKPDEGVISIRDIAEPGDLNYAFTEIIKGYLDSKGLNL